MDHFQKTGATGRAGSVRRRRRWLASAFIALVWPGALPAVPNVVASIGPLHALASAVMGDLGEPVQIVRGYGSPHTYQMRPSDAERLRDAALILWVGPALETFLERPLATARGRDGTRVLVMSALPELELLPNRKAGVIDAHGHDHGDTRGSYDAHIWLSPYNAKVMAAAIAAALAEIDPHNAPVYSANLRRFERRVDDMQTDITARLAPVRAVPFVVFHDAFQYFEKSFDLAAVGSLTVSPNRQPSAKRVKALRREIERSGARCVFREPQFESALVATLLEGTNARTGVLDPLGTDVTPGPDAYIELMSSNADALLDCLGDGKS